MTMHFNEFEVPAALEDEGLQELTGCPIHKRIDAVCTEPGCPNAAPPAAARPLWQRLRPAKSHPPEIYQTQPRDRCVL